MSRKRGGQKQPEDRVRDKYIKLRVSTRDLEWIRSQVDESGLRQSVWLRSRILGKRAQ